MAVIGGGAAINHHDVIIDCTTHWLYNDDSADI